MSLFTQCQLEIISEMKDEVAELIAKRNHEQVLLRSALNHGLLDGKAGDYGTVKFIKQSIAKNQERIDKKLLEIDMLIAEVEAAA